MISKEERSEYNRKYYEKNKDKILENLSKKVKCPCGKTVTYGCYEKHLLSNLHNKRMKLKDLFE